MSVSYSSSKGIGEKVIYFYCIDFISRWEMMKIIHELHLSKLMKMSKMVRDKFNQKANRIVCVCAGSEMNLR